MNSFPTFAVVRQTLCGLLAVLVSLPVLFALHRAFGLGSPPISGLLLLGGAVVLAFASAGLLGAMLGAARGTAGVAGLLGLGLGALLCFAVAPFYGSIVLDGVTRDATSMVWAERGRVTDAARNAVSGRAENAISSARRGRAQELRDQLSQAQRDANQATSPQSRQQAAQRARELTSQLAQEGKTKGIALVKSGAARLSAFALLFWVLIGPPFAAALECRRARRR